MMYSKKKNEFNARVIFKVLLCYHSLVFREKVICNAFFKPADINIIGSKRLCCGTKNEVLRDNLSYRPLLAALKYKQPRWAISTFIEDLHEPSDDSNVQFGRKSYWEDHYRQESKNVSEGNGSLSKTLKSENGFAWYSGWVDIQPFWFELVPNKKSRILVPGIGNDFAMVGMYDAGWNNFSAFDYSSEGVMRATELFGTKRLQSSPLSSVELRVADARNLPCYPDDSFDAVIDKGTYDAIFLAGGSNKEIGYDQLVMCVSELSRIVCPGGIVLSLTAVATDEIHRAFSEFPEDWIELFDTREKVHMTEDGYASINVDATMLAWKRSCT